MNSSRKIIPAILDKRNDKRMHIIINQYNFGGGGIPRDGLIAEWLGGSYIDTAQNYDGILSVNPPTLAPGIRGIANTAWQFNSANSQYIDFGVIAELKNVTKFSISSWLKVTGTNEIDIGEFASSTQATYIQILTGNDLRFGVRNGSTSFKAIAGFSSGNWIHVVLNFDGSQTVSADRVICWVNNTIPIYGGSYSNFATITPNNSTPFLMGKISTTFSNGYIGPTRIYDRILTADDINLLYNND